MKIVQKYTIIKEEKVYTLYITANIKTEQQNPFNHY